MKATFCFCAPTSSSFSVVVDAHGTPTAMPSSGAAQPSPDNLRPNSALGTAPLHQEQAAVGLNASLRASPSATSLHQDWRRRAASLLGASAPRGQPAAPDGATSSGSTLPQPPPRENLKCGVQWVAHHGAVLKSKSSKGKKKKATSDGHSCNRGLQSLSPNRHPCRDIKHAPDNLFQCATDRHHVPLMLWSLQHGPRSQPADR